MEKKILELMKEIQTKQGRTVAIAKDATLADLKFRSLDFAELALRMELETGKCLNFDAAVLRQVKTVGDVVQFLLKALQ